MSDASDQAAADIARRQELLAIDPRSSEQNAELDRVRGRISQREAAAPPPARPPLRPLTPAPVTPAKPKDPLDVLSGKGPYPPSVPAPNVRTEAEEIEFRLLNERAARAKRMVELRPLVAASMKDRARFAALTAMGVGRSLIEDDELHVLSEKEDERAAMAVELRDLEAQDRADRRAALDAEDAAAVAARP